MTTEVANEQKTLVRTPEQELSSIGCSLLAAMGEESLRVIARPLNGGGLGGSWPSKSRNVVMTAIVTLTDRILVARRSPRWLLERGQGVITFDRWFDISPTFQPRVLKAGERLEGSYKWNGSHVVSAQTGGYIIDTKPAVSVRIAEMDGFERQIYVNNQDVSACRIEVPAMGSLYWYGDIICNLASYPSGSPTMQRSVFDAGEGIYPDAVKESELAVDLYKGPIRDWFDLGDLRVQIRKLELGDQE